MIDQKILYVEFDAWLRKICLMDYPEPEIIAYYLGLFESSTGGVTAYLIGSKEFDEEDEDWACNDDFVPQPKLKYLHLRGTEAMNWMEVQSMVASMMKKFLKDPVHENCFLNQAEAIAVGFDEGNLEIVFRKKPD